MDTFARARQEMVRSQIAARGITDTRVLDAFATVPRERFVAAEDAAFAYEDRPVPIGEGQTISQPFIVALMLEAARIGQQDRVLEVGAGSGYAAAVASRCAGQVYAIERHPSLARQAAERWAALGYGNIEGRTGDGTLGWPEAAPFHAIVVSAGGPEPPRALMDQLATGGRLVIPVGPVGNQALLKVTRTGQVTFETETLGPVSFVPLIGSQGWAAGSPRESSATGSSG